MSRRTTGLRANALACFALFAAQAATAQSISGSDIKADYENPGYSASFSVTAYSPSTSTPTLGLKTQDGYTGVGVNGGRTGGEIDWYSGTDSESITLAFAQATQIGSFSLGLLFNGPEYGDVLEAARITINGDATYYLRASATENLANWFNGGELLDSFSYAAGAGTQVGEGGVITLFNPFGNVLVNTMTFAAAKGAPSCWNCGNQSDYNVVAVTPVPEPSTYALMLAGLGALAFMARRRRIPV
jgi:PEP-CTERM motif